MAPNIGNFRKSQHEPKRANSKYTNLDRTIQPEHDQSNILNQSMDIFGGGVSENPKDQIISSSYDHNNFKFLKGLNEIITNPKVHASPNGSKNLKSRKGIGALTSRRSSDFKNDHENSLKLPYLKDTNTGKGFFPKNRFSQKLQSIGDFTKNNPYYFSDLSSERARYSMYDIQNPSGSLKANDSDFQRPKFADNMS